MPQLLEVVIHGIFENVKGTAPLSLRKTLGRRWQALSAETQALTRRESNVIHLTAQGLAQNSAFKSVKLPTVSSPDRICAKVSHLKLF